MSNTDVEKLVCQICNQECIGFRGLGSHIWQHHLETNYESYYRKYLTTETNFKCPQCENQRKFGTLKTGYSKTCCSGTCRSKYLNERNPHTKREIIVGEFLCQICNKNFHTLRSLQSHLFGNSIDPDSCKRKIQMTAKEYYIKYMMPSDFNIICPYCKTNEKVFQSMLKGFSKTCNSRSCVGSLGSSLRTPDIPTPKVLNDATECQICNQSFEKDKGLASHITQNKQTHPTVEEYYCIFIEPDLDINCPICKIRKRKFEDIQSGFIKTCGEQECINQVIKQTKIENFTFSGQRFSKYPIEQIFDPVINTLKLDKNRCRHGKLNREFIHYVGNLKPFAKRNINAIAYDFTYLDKDLKTPLLICEFHGDLFHLKDNEMWKRRRECIVYKNKTRLIDLWIKDKLKKKYIQFKYPYCQYIIIWENNQKEGIEQFVTAIKNINDSDCNQILKEILKLN
jgi:rubredoxin